MAFGEVTLFAGVREWVCSQVRGKVLEVGIGTGRNLPYYPAGVTLTGIEPDSAMRERARLRALQYGCEIDLRIGDVQQLDFPDRSFDTVVCTFALCTVPDDLKAVGEMCRVLRPGGRLVLAEHVRSPVRLVRGGQRLLDPLTVRCAGEHLLREPLEHVSAERLVVRELRRRRLGIVELLVAEKRY